MINYMINVDDEDYTLPNYTLDIAEELEKVDKANGSGKALREKCRGIYNLIKKLVGEDVQKMVGDFASADPNKLNIIYLKIIDAYTRPLDSFETERRAQAIDDAGVSKVMDLIEVLSKLDPDKFNKLTK